MVRMGPALVAAFVSSLLPVNSALAQPPSATTSIRASVERHGRTAASVGARSSQLVTNRPAISPAMHPAAKGALIGAAVGAGSLGVFGLWYCTAGPGECSAENWQRGIPIWAAAGAAVGAAIGALR